jgi:epoxyqueuosine reductase
MLRALDTEWVVEQAQSLGFSLCGVAPAGEFPELARLPEWFSSGYAGQMKYLADPRRTAPASVLEGARSLIVCALNYNTSLPHTAEAAVSHASSNAYRQAEGGKISPGPRGAAMDDAPRGWISRYAWGEDYHRVLGGMLERLVAVMQKKFPAPFAARAYVDTGPIVERVAAKHAGLGWLGKNTCLIHPELGSWLFLGVIVTTLELPPSLGPGQAPQPDLCGQCTLCIDACPTQALVEPYVLDARRCISYLTIEHRGSLPEELRAAMGAHVFGCDICQDVCPFNSRAAVSDHTGFAPRGLAEKSETRKLKFENRAEKTAASAGMGAEPTFWPAELFTPPLEWLGSLTEQEYREMFRGSAMKRAKYQGLVRNACVALGNAAARMTPSARLRVRALLERLSGLPDTVIAEHARWALARLDR